MDELFRDLGFYVVPLGKEKIANPIAQLAHFINKTNKINEFSLRKNMNGDATPLEYINKLPDFAIIHRDGEVDLLEVKFRYNAIGRERHCCV